MAKEPAKSAMSGKKKSKKRSKVREMHIKPGAAGGFIVRHDMEPDGDEGGMGGANGATPPPQAEPPQFALGDQQALHDHIDQHMPDQAPAPMGGGM